MKKVAKFKLFLIIMLNICVATPLFNEVKADDNNYGIRNPRIVKEAEYANTTSTWDCIYFGNYYQSSSETKEPIKWRVLSVEGNDAFLLADTNLDLVYYNWGYVNITWAKCTIRSWLNGYDSSYNLAEIDYTNDNFINTAFSPTEKSALIETELTNENNSVYDTPGGVNTKDKIFLLSEKDVLTEKYGFYSNRDMYDPAKVSLNTNHIVNQGWEKINIQVPDAGEPHYWLLRSPGDWERGVIVVDGIFVDNRAAIVSEYWATRPALHLDLSKTDVWSPAGVVCSNGTTNEAVDYRETTNNQTTNNQITTNKDTNTSSNAVSNTITSVSSSKNIVCKRAKIKSAKNVKKKSIMVKYQKVANAKKYQIQYALNKKFTKSVKTKSTKKLTYKIKKLKSKKTYYVRVRGINGKIVGKWSKAKKIKVKK